MLPRKMFTEIGILGIKFESKSAGVQIDIRRPSVFFFNIH